MIKLLAKISWLSSLVIVALAAFSYCSAQTNDAAGTDLHVRVADQNGAVVIAAKVRLKTKTGKTQERTTNARGEAIYIGLTTGEYQLEVEASGFAVRHIDSVVLAVGHNKLD